MLDLFDSELAIVHFYNLKDTLFSKIKNATSNRGSGTLSPNVTGGS